MEKYELALAEFNQAIAKDKTYGMAYFNRAMLYKAVPELLNENLILRSRLQYAKRLEDLTSAIKYKPNFADSYIERGTIVSTSIGS